MLLYDSFRCALPFRGSEVPTLDWKCQYEAKA
jgi:hypothetical protein